MSHIHLLATDFRSDKRPTKLVENALEFQAENCNWKYVGAQNEKKAKISDYSLKELFDKRIQQKINSSIKKGDNFEYTEGFSAEVQTYVKTNYETGSYEIDFKQLIKERKEREKADILAKQARVLNNESVDRTLERETGLYRTGDPKSKGIDSSTQKHYDTKKL